MNRKFNIFAEQAGFYVSPYGGTYINDATEDNEVENEVKVDEQLEKLVRLIIEDCANICDSFGNSGDGYTCSSAILKTLKGK